MTEEINKLIELQIIENSGQRSAKINKLAKPLGKKWCSKGRHLVDITDFLEKKSSKGLQPYCRDCHNQSHLENHERRELYGAIRTNKTYNTEFRNGQEKSFEEMMESFLNQEEKSAVKTATVRVRNYQSQLRTLKIKQLDDNGLLYNINGRKSAICYQSKRLFPLNLLELAHIIPYKECTEDQKRDINNVVFMEPTEHTAYDRGYTELGESVKLKEELYLNK